MMKASLFFTLLLILVLALPCSKTEQGKVVGVKVSMSFSDLGKNGTNDLFYKGELIIEN